LHDRLPSNRQLTPQQRCRCGTTFSHQPQHPTASRICQRGEDRIRRFVHHCLIHVPARYCARSPSSRCHPSTWLSCVRTSGGKLAKPDSTTNRRVPSTCGSSVNSTRVIGGSPGLACHRNAKRCVGSTVSITPRLVPRGPVEPSQVKTTSPPGRRSMLACVPNQAPSWSACVRAAQTCAGGTGRMTSRSIESGTSTAACLACNSIVAHFCFQRYPATQRLQVYT